MLRSLRRGLGYAQSLRIESRDNTPPIAPQLGLHISDHEFRCIIITIIAECCTQSMLHTVSDYTRARANLESTLGLPAGIPFSSRILSFTEYYV